MSVLEGVLAREEVSGEPPPCAQAVVRSLGCFFA